MKAGKIVGFPALAVFVFIGFGSFMSCALPDLTVFDSPSYSDTGGSVDYTVMKRTDSPILIAWDPASADTASYRLYYRIHGENDWIFIAQVDMPAPLEYPVDMASIGPGIYDFAVTAVDQDGLESDQHMSIDQDADPPSGWYLEWGD